MRTIQRQASIVIQLAKTAKNPIQKTINVSEDNS